VKTAAAPVFNLVSRTELTSGSSSGSQESSPDVLRSRFLANTPRAFESKFTGHGVASFSLIISRRWLFAETRSGEVVANIALCLIHQANYLLDQQIRRLEQDFLREGGLRERMAKARIESRKNRG